MSKLKKTPSSVVAGVLSLLLSTVLVSACSQSSSESDVMDFSGSQLYGTGMSDGSLTLTFDDGPGPRTVELSKYLKSEGIRATFFIQGSAAAAYPDALKQLHKDGHILANHTYTHPRMTATSDPVAEVVRTDRLIKDYIKDDVFLFRAPYGDWNQKVSTILNSAGLTRYVGSIFWDIGGVRVEQTDGKLSRAADWACWAYGDSVEKCADGYMNETRDMGRGIVLFHDVHSKTIDMVKNMVPRLKNEGFQFVGLDTVPSVVKALRQRSDSSQTQDLYCPNGFQPTPVGSAGGLLCLSEKEASGPFTVAMQESCREKGGGQSCSNAVWSRGFATWVHGGGRCPVGATLDSELGVCVEGDEAFGPFSQEMVKRCRVAVSNPSSKVCESNRWSRRFVAGISR
jgi:peptidoglycan-N-acetylglucosamine deacetylase